MNRGMSIHGFPANFQSQSASQPTTPAATDASSSSNVNAVPAFDFPVPAIPPRLSKVGRRISELGSSMLFPEDEPPRRGSRDQARGREAARAEVPGMGDEPVMCPFCNKPLPPALFDAHRHAAVPPGRQGTATPEKRGSMASLRGLGIKTGELTRSISIGPGSMSDGALISAGAVGASGYASHRSSLTRTLVEEPTDLAAAPAKATGAADTGPLLESAEVVPKASAESFQPTLQAAEKADTVAAKALISRDEIRRWSVVAGMPVSPEVASSASAPSAPASAGEKQEAPAKSIPALPPPPPPASKIVKPAPVNDKTESPGGSSRFGFFGRGGKAKTDDDEDESDEDAPASGYAKLTGPASPDRDFEDEDPMERIGKAKAAQADISTPPETADSKDDAKELKEDKPAAAPVAPATPIAAAGAGADVKGTLQEVIGKVNAMSKAHEEIVHSHATLLTQLKIARSNLAMAEANTEMLEEQLKRGPRPAGTTTTPAGAAGSSAVVATPSGAVTAPRPTVSPAATRRSLDVPATSAGASTGEADAKQRASLEAPRVTAVVTPQPRRPGDAPEKSHRPHPNKLIMPPPNISNNGPATSGAGDNKGWSFWQGGKKKVPGLGNMKFTLPSADQIFDAIDAASRPPTPSVERQSILGTSAPGSSNLAMSPSGSGGAVPDPLSPNARGTSTVNSPSLARSTSSSAVVSPAMRGKAPMSPPDYMGEMNRMRQAQAANQARIDAMTKELVELRKGKVDMEAELENLSQALFEEANKMVADERRKRAEVEETLKEIKEEREALRQTVKLLNGQTEGDNESVKAPSIKLPDEEDLPEEFMPRDLDKHYEALRKTIHHVGESAAPTTGLTTVNPFEAAIASTDYATREYAPPSDIPTVPEGREVEMGSDGGSPGRERTRSISAPNSPNPWAMTAEPLTGGGGLGGIGAGEDVDPLDSSNMAISFGPAGVAPPIGDVGPMPVATSKTNSGVSSRAEPEDGKATDGGVKGLGLKLSEEPTPPSTDAPSEATPDEAEDHSKEKPKPARKESHQDELDRLMGDLAKVM